MVFKFTGEAASLRNLRISLIEVFTSDSDDKFFLEGLTSASSKCMNNHYLVSDATFTNNTCDKCFPAYNFCDTPATNNYPCNYLSSSPFAIDSSTTCKLDYLNIASLNKSDDRIKNDSTDYTDDSVIKITLIPEISYAYTFGFWMFSESLADNSYVKLRLDDIITVIITKLVVNGAPVNDTIEVKVLIQSVQIKLQGDNYSIKSFGKWTHIKIGLTYEDSYLIEAVASNLRKNGFISSIYYNTTSSANEIVKTEEDFYFGFFENNDKDTLLERPLRKAFSEGEFYEDRDNFVFEIIRTLQATERFYLRNIVLFNNYVRTNFED